MVYLYRGKLNDVYNLKNYNKEEIPRDLGSILKKEIKAKSIDSLSAKDILKIISWYTTGSYRTYGLNFVSFSKDIEVSEDFAITLKEELDFLRMYEYLSDGENLIDSLEKMFGKKIDIYVVHKTKDIFKNLNEDYLTCKLQTNNHLNFTKLSKLISEIKINNYLNYYTKKYKFIKLNDYINSKSNNKFEFRVKDVLKNRSKINRYLNHVDTKKISKSELEEHLDSKLILRIWIDEEKIYRMIKENDTKEYETVVKNLEEHLKDGNKLIFFDMCNDGMLNENEVIYVGLTLDELIKNVNKVSIKLIE